MRDRPVCTQACLVSTEVRRGCWIPRNWSYRCLRAAVWRLCKSSQCPSAISPDFAYSYCNTRLPSQLPGLTQPVFYLQVMVPSWMWTPWVTTVTQPWLHSWITWKQRRVWVTLGTSVTSIGPSSIWSTWDHELKWESLWRVPSTNHAVLQHCIETFCLLLIVYRFLYICTLLAHGCGRTRCFPPQQNSQVHQTRFTQWTSLGSGCHIFAKMFWPKKKKKCCQSCCLGFTLLLFLYSFEYENFDILIFSLSVA